MIIYLVESTSSQHLSDINVVLMSTRMSSKISNTVIRHIIYCETYLCDAFFYFATHIYILEKPVGAYVLAYICKQFAKNKELNQRIWNTYAWVTRSLRNNR